jgi:type I restriction enzyme M protein
MSDSEDVKFEIIDDEADMFKQPEQAEVATIMDPEGKEVAREVVWAGEKAPDAPEGGKVKLAPVSRLFPNSAFGYRTITVERPLRDAAGKVMLSDRGKNKGKPQPDGTLRDTENVPLAENVDAYFKREVLPHAEDAWIDESKTKVGYELPFNRHFFVFEPARPLEEIDADLKQVTDLIKAMIEDLAA